MFYGAIYQRLIAEELKMIKNIENNPETELAKEKTYDIDYSAEEVFEIGANYLDELASKNFFLDAIKNFVKKRDYFSGNMENPEDIIDFIKKAYEKAGIKGDKKKGAFSYNPSSIKDWVCGKRLPSKNETQRIALCLGMNISEAIEFIFKGSLVKPFNFKDIQDSVYYFCLNTGKTFAEAQQILEEIENANVKVEEYPENDTIKIGEQIESIKAKDELIKYLSANKEGFKNQNQTALTKLKELIKNAAGLAEWERKEIFHDTSIPSIESENDVPAILSVILGYEARAKINGVEVYKKKISDSNFPELVKNNFPQPQQLQDVLNGKKTSAEAIRKAIILFTFYNLFSKRKKDKKNKSNNYFDTYSDAIDETLYKCGYIQMYWKHPYDWMFGFCAGQTDENLDPLDMLRELIAIFYSELDDMYSVENQFVKK